jgi:hypothetical protein
MRSYVGLAVALCCAHAGDVFAYAEPTHEAMSRAAADRSVLAKPEVLKQLGLLGLPIDDSRQTFSHWKSDAWFSWDKKLTIRDLVGFGAVYEDERDMCQALHHFFDPVDGKALTVGGFSPGKPSPTWILEDQSNIGDSQPFSYKKARQYFYNALTLRTEAERKRNWGRTFQALGHVVHHLQDMAQPQHVRNDAHCGEAVCKLIGQYNPSGYEAWLKAETAEVWGKNKALAQELFSRYPVVYDDQKTEVFTTPRKFWTTAPDGKGIQGAGIAQYTNRGFFSDGTLPKTGLYASPSVSPTNKQTFDIEVLCQADQNAGRPACPPGTTGKMTFYGSTVVDSLEPAQTRDNPRALSVSIFDADLINKNYSPIQALNRFNYDAAKEFLIPRAVAYSAGLINYFFRGRMEISLPDEGLYGVVDHADPSANTKDSGGFRKIKLKVKNVTPGNSGIEPMKPGGKLVLAARFHRNNCYTPSLSGEYGSVGIDWRNCRNPLNEVVVSAEVAAPAGINAQASQVVFDFPTAIPINATDLYLQVVYRGPLGDETDAVVVAIRDISEPHYLHTYARWDQFTYSNYYPVLDSFTGHLSWEQWCTGGSAPGFPTLEACNDALGMTTRAQYSRTDAPIPGYDPDNPSPLDDPDDPLNTPGRWHQLVYQPPFQPAFTTVAPVGTLTRVAILTDAQPSNRLMWTYEMRDTTHGTGKYQWMTSTPMTTIAQVDPISGNPIWNVAYYPVRGIHAPAGIALELGEGTASPMPELILVRSQIHF